ncbi:MAG: cupin domain-containing protein [Desulfarculus sp.]|nr:MAG: cupin domain-containing protein [Desulfarculus sp.]
MFYKRREAEAQGQETWLGRRTLTHGRRTLLCEFRNQAGHTLREHSHPHEQIGYLVAGKIVFTIGGQRHLAEPGDSWCIKADVPHSAEALEDSVVIEVFSPVREDYLP